MVISFKARINLINEPDGFQAGQTSRYFLSLTKSPLFQKNRLLPLSHLRYHCESESKSLRIDVVQFRNRTPAVQNEVRFPSRVRIVQITEQNRLDSTMLAYLHATIFFDRAAKVPVKMEMRQFRYSSKL